MLRFSKLKAVYCTPNDNGDYGVDGSECELDHVQLERTLSQGKRHEYGSLRTQYEY